MKKHVAPVVVIVFLALLVLVTFVCVWWQKFSPRQQPLSSSSIPNTQMSAVDTTRWKTYQNERYGFQLKYPPEWQIVHDDDDPESGFFLAIGIPQAGPGRDYEYQYNLLISPTKYTDVDAWFTAETNDRTQLQLVSSATLFHGYPVLVISDPITEGGCRSEFMTIVRKGYVYQFPNPACNRSEEVQAMNDSLVPMNTDGDPDPNTIEWKIHRNEQYGFELAYPTDWVIFHDSSRIQFYSRDPRTLPMETGVLELSVLPPSRGVDLQSIYPSDNSENDIGFPSRCVRVSVGGKSGHSCTPPKSFAGEHYLVLQQNGITIEIVDHIQSSTTEKIIDSLKFDSN